MGDFLKIRYTRITASIQNLDLQEDRLEKFVC